MTGSYFPNALRALGDALSAERLPGRRPRWFGEREIDPRAYEREFACDWISGSFMLARREALESAGFFDERFFMYCDEIDLCRRIKTAGWEIRHLPQMTIGPPRTQRRRQARTSGPRRGHAYDVRTQVLLAHASCALRWRRYAAAPAAPGLRRTRRLRASEARGEPRSRGDDARPSSRTVCLDHEFGVGADGRPRAAARAMAGPGGSRRGRRCALSMLLIFGAGGCTPTTAARLARDSATVVM